MSQTDSNGGTDGTASSGATPYVVTRGQPPREHQFVKGKSGNPGGRPKGSQNFSTILRRELDRSATVTIDGKKRKVSKREVIAMRLLDKAIKGDQKAIDSIIRFDLEAEAKNDLPAMDTNPERDAAILAAYLSRLPAGGDHA